MRCAPLLLALAACLPAAEKPANALGASDVELLDERAWVESVSRRRQDVASAPAPVEVVLYEDYAASPAATLADYLRYTPGVSVYQLRHGQHEVGLRGYNGAWNTRLLVLQDDWSFAIPIMSATTWTGFIDYSDLDRVEIIKGPASVTYGANAFGGVISLRSRTVGDRPTLTTYGRAGTPGALEGDATFATPLPGGAYAKLSAGWSRLEDLPGVESTVPFRQGAMNREDTRLDLDVWRVRGVLGVRLGSEWNAEMTARLVQFRTWEPIDGTAYGPPDLPLRDSQVTAELRGPWLWLQHAERSDRPDYLNLKPDPSTEPTLPFLFIRYGFETHERRTRARVNTTSGDHELSAGVERRAWRGESNLWVAGGKYQDRSTWGTARLTEWGAFAEDQWRLAPEVQLTAGVRGDLISDTGVYASPRLAVNWAPNANSFFLLSYSGGYRPPTILERFQRDTFTTTDDDLQPETIQSLEGQWRWREGHEHEVSLGLFANRSNNQILRTPLSPAQQQKAFLDWALFGDPDPGPQYNYSNLDNPTTVFGVEIAGRQEVQGTPFTLWANATWQHYRTRHEERFSSPGFTIPFDPSGKVYYRYDYTLPRDVNGPPEWIGNLGVEWNQDGWFVSAAGRLMSSRTVYDLGHTRLLSDPYIALDRVDGYAVCDLALGWRSPDRGRRTVKLAITDVLDETHTEGIRTTPATLAASNESQYTSDIGRQISLVGSWEF